MNIEQKEMHDFTIIKIKENSLNAINAAEIKSKAIDQIEKGKEKIILDLGDVEFIDSAGLGAIIGIYKMLSDKEHFFLVSHSKKNKIIFQCTGIDSIIKIFPTVDEVLFAYSKKSS